VFGRLATGAGAGAGLARATAAGTGSIDHASVQPDQEPGLLDTFTDSAIGCATAGTIASAADDIRADGTNLDDELRLQREFLEENGNTIRKGNIGEMHVDQYFNDLGRSDIQQLHTSVNSLDAPLKPGIDHIYQCGDGLTRSS